jgi:hypothetical protein
MDIVRTWKNVFIDTLILFHASEYVIGTREDFVHWDRIVVRDMSREDGFVRCF